MISVLCTLIVLILGYILYGRLVAGVFGPDDRKTPAYAREDGVDFVPMKTWKAFLVQLLNIAGTGPIFGALMGACFGPVVFLWIVLGAAFMSAVSMTYILMAKEGFRLSERIAWPVGVCFAAALFVLYLVLTARHRRDTPSSESL